MGEVKVSINEEGALKVSQRDDPGYVNATWQKQCRNIPVMFTVEPRDAPL